MDKHASRLLIASLLAAGVWWLLGTLPGTAPHVDACAFLRNPHAYEADSARTAYFSAMDAASVNALFPNDALFGLPAVETGTRSNRTTGAPRVPQTLLRAIGWNESNLAMAARSVTFESTGQALVSFDCGYGIMQITTGMTVPLGTDNLPTTNQANTAGHYAYNIGRGAAMLAAKWNDAPELRPIAGSDTNSDPNILENWYFAVWAYNGFTGPGASQSNHPLDTRFSNPREHWRCDGTQSRTRYPYQELVWGCIESPPSRAGQKLWTAIPISYPNFSDPKFSGPLALSKFVFPYSGMDMPTPKPSHTEAAPSVPSDIRTRLLGSPSLSVEQSTVDLDLDNGPEAAKATITVRNPGTGILVWMVTTSAGWIVVDTPAGVALGSEVACGGTGCKREGTFTVSVNPTLLPQSSASGEVTITAANSTDPPIVLPIGAANAAFDIGAPGTSRAY